MRFTQQIPSNMNTYIFKYEYIKKILKMPYALPTYHQKHTDLHIPKERVH